MEHFSASPYRRSCGLNASFSNVRLVFLDHLLIFDQTRRISKIQNYKFYNTPFLLIKKTFHSTKNIYLGCHLHLPINTLDILSREPFCYQKFLCLVELQISDLQDRTK